MSAISNYFFLDPIKNLSTEELKTLHKHSVCNKAKICMLRVMAISLLALSVFSILSGFFASSVVLGLVAFSFAARDFLQNYKVTLIENLLKERGILATHQIYNWGWGGFSYSHDIQEMS
jgi:hypothetical protein